MKASWFAQREHGGRERRRRVIWRKELKERLLFPDRAGELIPNISLEKRALYQRVATENDHID